MTSAQVPEFSLPARNRRVLLMKRPSGIPQANDFILDEVPLEPLRAGEIRVRNVFLSVDPAQRGWASDVANYSEPVPLNGPMRSLASGVITESANAAFPPGTYVYGWFGWQQYATVGVEAVLTRTRTLTVPLSSYCGILGINGLTASLAFSKLGRPMKGETVLVSTAAGAVGSVVGQLARKLGLRTIGLTSTDDKAARLLERYGYDVAINYRAPSWELAVRDAAPGGIDIYFDNVGGSMLDRAIRLMRVGGRIIQCGSASVASWSPPPTGMRNEREILTRRLTWSGFLVFDHMVDFAATLAELTAAVASGDLVYDEDIDRGLESAPDALSRLYNGENMGKKLIYVG